MPSRVEDYEVLYTIGSGSYGRCQKIRRKSDGKVSNVYTFASTKPLATCKYLYLPAMSLLQRVLNVTPF